MNGGLSACDGCKILLADPADGQLNVSGKAPGGPTVWVREPSAAVAPILTGPASLSLAQDYAATSTGAYTVAGIPEPTVTEVSGDAKITWNNATKKLDIAAGLAAGSYPVVLKAANGISPDATLTFTLTVTPPSQPPPKGILGTNARYNQWWHYILFFLCFGFIWMWF